MLLDAKGLTYSRPSAQGPIPVFEDLDFSVAQGELVDMRGPSGSGKTTLLLALARLLPGATAGSLELDGRPSSDWRPEEWRAAVALLPQKPALVPGSVRDDLRLPWTLKIRVQGAPPADPALREALDSVGLDDVELERDVARLSAGQAARVALLRLVLAAPRVLLLDEPDAALDDESAELVGKVVRGFVARGGAAVRVRHLRVDAAADRRLSLHEGHLTEVAS